MEEGFAIVDDGCTAVFEEALEIDGLEAAVEGADDAEGLDDMGDKDDVLPIEDDSLTKEEEGFVEG